MLTIAVIGLGAYAVFRDEINRKFRHAFAPNKLYGVPCFGKMESTNMHMGYHGKTARRSCLLQRFRRLQGVLVVLSNESRKISRKVLMSMKMA